MTDVTQGQDAHAAAPKDAPSSAGPDVDDLFPKQDVDDLFPANYKSSGQMVRNVSPIQDMIFSDPGRSHARVLDAFGYGFKQNWGAGQHEFSEADDFMRKAGVYNDYAKGQHNIIKAANEAIMRPAVAAIVSAKSAFSGVIAGTQAAVAQEGEELGVPKLGKEIAAIPEAFPRGINETIGVPHLPEPIAQAKSLDVIGSGEGGYFGTKPVTAEAPVAVAESAKAQDVAKPEALPGHDAEAAPAPVAQPAAPETAPDIHAVARQIAPDTFHEFDALAQKKDTFRRWIDELREVRDQTAHESAPHAAEIAELQAKLPDATPRLAKKYNERLAPMIEERDAYIAEHTRGDSADMAKIREQLMQADYRMRDLAPDVSKAYRDAEVRMPKATETVGEAGVENSAAGAKPQVAQATPQAASPVAARVEPPMPEGPEPLKPGHIRYYHGTAYTDASSFTGKTFVTPHYPYARDYHGGLGNAPDGSIIPNNVLYTDLSHAEADARGLIDEVNRHPIHGPIDDGSAVLKPMKPAAHEETSSAAVPDQISATRKAAPEPAKAAVVAPAAAAAEVKPPAELPIAHAPSIVADVSQKLKAAGRPAEEADAAAQIVAAYWETRAQRFEGAKGTATEMYAREAPEIVAGKQKARARQPEMAQTAAGQKGRIRLREDGRATITLLKTADASTFIHETGHEWLERMLDDARDDGAPQALKSDAQTVLKWLGAEGPDAVKTRHHEKFARGFETYMLEGRAPSQGLARVFAKFKDWLSTIYKTAAALKAPISNDIRGVFDRLLAEKPEKTVIAPERERGPSFADTHERVAEETQPVAGFETSGKIRAERDLAATKGPVKDDDARLGNAREGTEEHAPGSAESSGHADAAGLDSGATDTSGGSGALGEGGSEAAGESAGTRPKSERLNTKPTPLLRFLASKGGIKASDELISDLKQSLGASNRLIPGFGQLIRQSKQLSSAARKAGRSEAMTIDRAREAAIEAGHLPQGASITDFLDAIDNEVRGIGHEVDRPHDPAEQAHAEHNFVEGLNDTIKASGGAELTEAERARALELYKHEGLHEPTDIIERLALEADDAQIDSGAAERAPGIVGWDAPAPGWELSNDGRTAPGEGQGAAGASAEQPGSRVARTGSETQDGHPLDATADLPKSETQLIDKAGNIRLDNLGTPEDVSAVIRATAVANDDFLGARRNVIPDAEVLKLADALGMDAEQIAQRQLGQAYNAEQIVAARKLLIQSATDVRDMAAKIAGGSEADVLAYAQARARHLMIQEQVSGITAEAGRALRAFRSMAGSKEAADISAFLKNTQGKTLFQMKEEGALLAMMGTPQQISKAVHEANLSTWQKTRSGVLSWFINNLISGPITHGGYIVGNITTQLFKATVDTSVAAAMGAIRNAPAAERVHIGEVGAQLYGMVRGMRDGYAPAITAMKTGVPFMKGDVDGMLGQIEAAHRPQAIPGQIGYVMETPSRAVTAIHTMHYSMNYEAEIARRAYRAALADGLENGSTEFNSKIADFTQAPPAAEMQAAHDEALKGVLMKSSQFGTSSYHLQQAVNKNILAKIVMPFMQVGANILHESFIERTPLGAMSKTVRENMMGTNGPVARDLQRSRIAVGIGISTAVVGLTAEGLLTGGGPSDHKEMAIKEMTGWRPYSIKVGESYVPYRKYLGGLGPLIAGTADIYEAGHALSEEGLSKAAAASLFGFAEVIADESWAKGLANFIDAARHWDRDGERYLRNLAADFIPMSVGLSQLTNVTDPYRREVRSMLDVARAHIPGMSRGLFPVRDIWGEPIESHTALGPSKANHDPATQALLTAGYYPGKLERKIRGVDLTDQQYDDFTRIGGRMARMRMNALANTPGFAVMPKQIQADKIKEIIESAREGARSMILMQNPDIITKANAAKLAKFKGEPVH